MVKVSMNLEKIEIEKEGMDFSAEDSPERASDMQWQD